MFRQMNFWTWKAIKFLPPAIGQSGYMKYMEDFRGKEDVLRYVLCANAPETKDNDFTWKDFQARNNNELVAYIG